MKDHNKNSSRLSLVIISIDLDSIVLRTLKEVQACFQNSNFFNIKDIEFIIIYSNGEVPLDKTNIKTFFFKVEQKNAAFSRNCGVKKSKSHNIAFLDNDTLVNTAWIKKVFEFCQQPYLDAVFFQEENETESVFDHKINQIPPIYYADTAGCLVKREVFLSNIKFNEEFDRCEDADFATSLIRFKFLIEFSDITFKDSLTDSLVEKASKLEKTLPFVSMLVDKFSTENVTGVKLKPIESIKTKLNLLQINNQHSLLSQDFFIFKNDFYYFKDGVFNSTNNFKVYLKSINTKIIEVKIDE